LIQPAAPHHNLQHPRGVAFTQVDPSEKKANFETSFSLYIGSSIEIRRFQKLWVSWILNMYSPHGSVGDWVDVGELKVLPKLRVDAAV
jgi:hypothetical protein